MTLLLDEGRITPECVKDVPNGIPISLRPAAQVVQRIDLCRAYSIIIEAGVVQYAVPGVGPSHYKVRGGACISEFSPVRRVRKDAVCIHPYNGAFPLGHDEVPGIIKDRRRGDISVERAVVTGE